MSACLELIDEPGLKKMEEANLESTFHFSVNPNFALTKQISPLYIPKVFVHHQSGTIGITTYKFNDIIRNSL